MKRFLCLTAALCLQLSLTGCGVRNEEYYQPLDGPGMERTWEVTDAAGLKSLSGILFGVPKGAESPEWRWNLQEEYAEFTFWLDDVLWTAKAKQTEEFEDISGMSYAWEPDNMGYDDDIRIETGNFCLPGTLRLLQTDYGVAHLAYWYDESRGMSLTLSALVKAGVVRMPASEVFLLDDSGEGMEVYPPELPAFDAENAADAFRELVAEQDGFEIVYLMGQSLVVRCGGKGDVFWYAGSGPSGTEAAIADFSVEGGEALYNWQPASDEEEPQTVAIDANMVLAMITERVYTYRSEFDPAEFSPAELVYQGVPCLRYNFYGGLVALDVSRDYGVTLRYTYSRDGINDLELTEINTGIEVIPPV